MTHQEIIEKAIQKAIESGWVHKTPDDTTRVVLGDPVQDVVDYWDLDIFYSHIPYIIFNHDFAKALWGEKPIDKSESASGNSINWNTTPAWVEHLQQMVIAEDPIKYLGENI